MNGFEKMKFHKCYAIKQSVKDLVSRKGFDALTIKAIAEAAKVSQVTIYNHFTGKNELIRSVTEEIVSDICEAYNDILSSGKSFMEKLEQVFEFRIRAVIDGSWYFILSAMKSDYKIDHVVKTGPLLETKKILYNLIEQGKTEGEVNVAIETETILQYIESFKDWFYPSMDMETNTKKAKELMELFIYGIKGKS